MWFEWTMGGGDGGAMQCSLHAWIISISMRKLHLRGRLHARWAVGGLCVPQLVELRNRVHTRRLPGKSQLRKLLRRSLRPHLPMTLFLSPAFHAPSAIR